MATKLYVGSLSFNVDSDQLRELFADAGTVVSATVITDRETSRSKGFGFVEMETQEQAEEAIKSLSGKEVDGRALVVNIARPKESRPNFARPRRY